MTALRTLAFGDGSRWGVSWAAGSAGADLTALGSGADVDVMPGLSLPDPATGPADDLRLDGDGVALLTAPVGELVDVHAAEDGIAGSAQLCRVTGTFGRGEVDCLGVRCWWADGLELGRFESIRVVSVWFDPDEAFALTAFRPRKAKAHDGDLTAAVVIDADRSAAVDDPRLSTTYAADGWPARAGLELWLTSETDSEQQYPRRASGEAAGPRAEAVAGELELRAEPFRWHSRGRVGSGMYLLARGR